MEVSYGEDNTGNLFVSRNISTFALNLISKTKKQRAHLVTADGGFNVFPNFNVQEQIHNKLMLAQIIGALLTQADNGHFVLKMFTTQTLVSLDLLYILKYYYKELYIYKPVTSRPRNSENYIIAKNFKGVSSESEIKFTELLTDLLDEWEGDGTKEKPGIEPGMCAVKLKCKNYVYRILSNKIPKDFIAALKTYNSAANQRQITEINGIIAAITAEEKPIIDQVKEGNRWLKKYKLESKRENKN